MTERAFLGWHLGCVALGPVYAEVEPRRPDSDRKSIAESL